MIRLLNISTLQFREFHEDNTPPYAIASHRWQDEEATFKDVLKNRNRNTAGFRKVQAFCNFIKSWGDHVLPEKISWLWIDTCCIDQKSSAELSEAINSMYEWYANAEICVAYLFDVQLHQEAHEFEFSSWFKRGWTLQELIAPSLVLFTSCDWETLGHKRGSQSHEIEIASHILGSELNSRISLCTGICEQVLLDHTKLEETSYEVRLSWMDTRRTTRIEDEAYCLLGIFGINMPLLYGERQQARLRLLSEILRRRLVILHHAGNQSNPQQSMTGYSGLELGDMESASSIDVTSLQNRVAQLEIEQLNRRLCHSFRRRNTRAAGWWSTMLEQYFDLQHQAEIETLAMQKAEAFWNPLEDLAMQKAEAFWNPLEDLSKPHIVSPFSASGA